ncbi:MAG TPA: SUMF1/EgtB/PvdO family nonheme iron enzyme [Polyangiaceae bacterium]
MSDDLARFAAGGLSGVAAVVLTVYAALAERTGPARCPAGLVAVGPRCCGAGQTLEGGRCSGKPTSCAETQVVAPTGCVAKLERVSVASGKVRLNGPDWDGRTEKGSGLVAVARFEIDANEVTNARWEHCRAAKKCDSLRVPGELGQPVRGVTPEEAEVFCEYAGGRLPGGAEWILAASGAEARRYPWGSTGLVCRRAAFGLASGPCADGGDTPDLAGARPDGSTPDGVADLAGNVAEWTRERDGSVRARGGSFRVRTAAELKGWSAVGRSGAADDIGFRCAFPLTDRKD